MRKLTYLAVVEPGNDCFGIFFPDLLGCTSMADDLDSIVSNAKEALSLHIYGMEKDGDILPEPSAKLSADDIDGCMVMPVTIFPDVYRQERENRRVKTNVTIPAWLKELAEANKVNYSRILEAGLTEYLGIKK